MAKFSTDEEIHQERDDRPPDLVRTLTSTVVEYYNATNKKLQFSKRVPSTPIDIAKWWAANERKPMKPHENPQKRINRHTQKETWYCPYIDYCVYTLKLFMTQPADFQDVIIDAKLSGIQWRGESREQFGGILEEARKYREDPKKYQKQTIKQLKRIVK